ncbi:delta 1-pyrroline-5-carboxylate reductase [Imshaugia aleurites]|uniref:Delta 1-pyrroline-5-carboxylate reductase n=1 Tax=Imshaugia aleurites TaxID=172621 RepID=A0A8H3FKE1_9LECA|nr:delta 1-pyrroline-5-carboxylate reductase [Imshaugia aleurites]
MPNTACFVGTSTTVITSTPAATPSALHLVDYLFTAIGTVAHIDAARFDVCTALCGSTPAFFALFLEALLDGAVALGLRCSEAQIMAAETMKGAAMLVLSGETPETVKEKVATPCGSTIQGLL